MKEMRNAKGFLLSLPRLFATEGVNPAVVKKALELCDSPSLIEGIVREVLKFLPTEALKNDRTLAETLLASCKQGEEGLKYKTDDLSSLTLEHLQQYSLKIYRALDPDCQPPIRNGNGHRTFFGRRAPRAAEHVIA